MNARKRHWLADWRQVRVWEGDTRHLLRQRHALWCRLSRLPRSLPRTIEMLRAR